MRVVKQSTWCKCWTVLTMTVVKIKNFSFLIQHENKINRPVVAMLGWCVSAVL